jgi:hypothetical protein
MTHQPSTLGLVGLVAVSLALAGCGGGGSGSPTPTPTPAPTPAPTPTPTTPTLQSLANQPPVGVYLALLLTDGTVMVQANPTGKAGASAADFYRLTPDASGAYLNGTWTHLAAPPAGYAPYAGAQAVLADGRVLFVGGEYNQDNYALPFAPSALTNMSAVYDPVANAWTMIPAPPGQPYIGDVPSSILPDGRFVFGSKLDKKMWALDPTTLAWTAIVTTGKADNFAEEGFTLLPSGDILTVDMVATPGSEQFVSTSGLWFSAGATPALLASPTDYPGGLTYGPAPVQVVGGVTYGPGPAGTYFPPGEIGPAILRPDGTVFATGSAVTGQAGHTAIYHASATSGTAGSWSSGPDFPNLDNAGDSSAALLPSGVVLVAGDSGALYEFDGSSLNKTVSAPAGSTGVEVFLLPLPSGQTLVLTPTLTVQASLYTPTGSPSAAWAPTISAVATTLARGHTYALTGTQLNGLSQAADYGDELSSSTNYPLVRLKVTATGHVFYARTHGHSSMGVATGSLSVTTNFDVPTGAETGAATLVVVANGIASAPVSVTIN